MPGIRLAVVLLLVLAACSEGRSNRGGEGDADRRLQVVASVAPITSIVAAVAGDRADVTGLIPEGTNSHTYEPPPSVAATLARADILFLNGLKLEGPAMELAETSLRQDAELVLLGERALDEDEYIYDFSFPREGGKPNPHAWTDPTLAMQYARVVFDTLSEADAAGRSDYRANLDRFIERADTLDKAVRTASASVPVRKLLTYHDGYAYFARTYGWEVIGAVQVSDLREPTPAQLGALIEQVKQHKVPAIFGSEVFPSPVLEQIGRETGVRYVDTLRDDDLPGEPGDPDHSWVGMMRMNFITMVESLGGDAKAVKDVPLVPALPNDADYPQ